MSAVSEGERPQPRPEPPDGEQMPRVRVTRRRVVASLLFVAAIVAFLYLGLPKLVGLRTSLRKLEQGDAWWLAAAAVLECLSFGGYVVLFRAVFVRRTSRVGWRASYQITMAGLAATRLFAAAGAGGIALTAWALRRSGMPARLVAARMIAFMALLYGVYMGSLVAFGLGLYLGLLPGSAPFAITVVPALFGAAVIALCLAISCLPADFESLVGAVTAGRERLARIVRPLVSIPRAATLGVRTARELVAGRDLGLLGAIGWWGFDIATLWACFRAFGASPPVAIVVMGYFVGWIANTLPLPGGIGGVEGGMIGAFSAFGVSVQSGVVAVLAYRAFSFWLPTVPGAVAYFQLRRTVSRWRAGAPAAIPSAGRSPSGAPSYTR